VIKRHPDGFGFLLPFDSTHEDVYVPKHEMVGIMTNDILEVEVFSTPGAGGARTERRYHGEVVRVVRRSSERIVGRFLPVDVRYGVILDEQRGWGADLRISTEDSLGANEGDLVAVEVLSYPDGQSEFTGRVVEVIGDHDDPMNDVRRVIHSQGLPYEFSPAAEEQAKAFGNEVRPRDTKGREDLRSLSLITIDGVTARDFDDAVFVEETQRGFRLVTAIADVSHYVKPGTDLDHDAYERGNSTYFPNHVIPMLPEGLSNELCSLRPHVDRLCFACEMQIDRQGELLESRFFEGVMRSQARVTYGEAQEIIDGQSLPQFSAVSDMIRRAAGLAQILMAKRLREGSLDLEIPETQVVVDESGEAIDIVRSERLFAHRLIEELMLVTNIAAARFLRMKESEGIYRIHEPPKEDNLRLLEGMLWNLGKQSLKGGRLQKKLTSALKKFDSHPAGPALNIMTLRSMQQARYSAENVGHFGLGFADYSHFTSPIRRYPDLILHRLIKSLLNREEAHLMMSREEIESACVHLSATEQRSTKAERSLVSIKKARFMSQFVGKEFPGMISSVTRFGVFVALKQYDVDGLIKLEELGDDRFDFDEEKMLLVGRRTRRTYALGDAVTVQVVACDVSLGKIDLKLGESGRPQVGTRSERTSQRRGKSAKGSPKETETSARVGAAKRGPTPNNSRRVRKKRVSKRR
jgi:ribonuclease R